MHNVVKITKENKTLDVLKFYACILIAATHLPSVFSSSVVDTYYNEWYFRFAVPLFFVSSGYFFYKTRRKTKTIKRIFVLYLISYLLYLPRILQGTENGQSIFSVLRWNLVIGYEHLWYLNATLQGMLVWFILEKIPVIRTLFHKLAVPGSVCLLIFGSLLDEHYHLLSVPVLQKLGDFLRIFGGPRNVVFMGFPLLLSGGAAARYEQKLSRIPVGALCIAWVVLRVLGFLECTYLMRGLGIGFGNDVTLFGCLAGWVLFLISFRFQFPISEKAAKLLRKMAEYVYVLHPLAATLLVTVVFSELSPAILLTGTVILCCGCCVLVQKILAVFRKNALFRKEA